MHFQPNFPHNDRQELYKLLRNQYKIDKDKDDYGNIYRQKLKNKQEIALENSKKLTELDRDTNPAYTLIHKLIEALEKLKQ